MKCTLSVTSNISCPIVESTQGQLRIVDLMNLRDDLWPNLLLTCDIEEET